MLRKNVLLISTLAILFSGSLFGHEIAGVWRGTLTGGSKELQVVVTIAKAGTDGWKATIQAGDNPAASGDVTSVKLDGSNLTLVVAGVGGTYEGRISTNGSFCVGIWKRYRNEMPLVFRHGIE